VKNHKYFAKYIPVEGEIKENDLVINIDSDSRPFPYAGEHPQYFKKVELSLCSRDIQVGDENVRVGLDGYQPKITKGDIEAIKFFREAAPDHPDNDYFKVVGKISPEATWVREGDEFWESEIKLEKHLIMKDGSVFFSSSSEKEQSFRCKYADIVHIQCPTCKTFH